MKGIQELLSLHCNPPDHCDDSGSSGGGADNDNRQKNNETGNQNVVILDGGLATAMERTCGVDLNLALWSAHYIRVDPDLIQRMHREYFEAGADIVIGSSYQASIEGFKKEFPDDVQTDEDAKELMLESVRIASRARQQVAIRETTSCSTPGGTKKNNKKKRPLVVAASIGPYGACIPGGEEYHGDYGRELGQAFLEDWHRPRFEVLVDQEDNSKEDEDAALADILAMETIPCLEEVRALLALLKTRPRARAWMSVTCKDETSLRSGDSIADFVREIEKHDDKTQQWQQVEAIGVNCTPRQFIGPILSLLAKHTSRPIVVYPNNGDIYDADRREWIPSDEILTAEEYGALTQTWRDTVKDGRPMILGGCCTTDQTYIRAVSRHFRDGT